MFNFVQVSNRKIGKITFDVVTSEDHQSDLFITENPIESGASIADHAVIQPKQVVINGIMVDYDNSILGAGIPGAGNIRGGIDFLNRLPLPCEVVNQTAQTLAKAGRLISSGLSSIDSDLNKARKLAPFLPDFSLGEILSGSLGGDNRVQKCYTDLLACQKSGETIDVQTGIYLYKNMLIQSITVNQSQDGSATFTIIAREIFIVETMTTKSGGASGKNKSGRSGAQSASKNQRGNTQPIAKEPKKKTSLYNIIYK